MHVVSPHTLDEALATLAQGRHRVLAGGTDLMVSVNHGSVLTDNVVALDRVTELRGVSLYPDYVRLVRRAAIDGGNHLVIDLAGVLRPMFDRAAEYFEREMAVGTFLRHDARHLMISGYGALLSYFSDSALLEGLLDNDPFSGDELERRADHVIELFASALGVHRER